MEQERSTNDDRSASQIQSLDTTDLVSRRQNFKKQTYLSFIIKGQLGQFSF
jgi:hypothetical protein